MMNRKRSFYLWVSVLAMLLGTNLPAQDIAGSSSADYAGDDGRDAEVYGYRGSVLAI